MSDLSELHQKLDRIEALLREVRDDLRKRKPYQRPTLTEVPTGDPDVRCPLCHTETLFPLAGRPDWVRCLCGHYLAAPAAAFKPKGD